MNRIDRISAILIQLQSKKVVKGSDIAKRFNISLRTAYRDIRTLEEAGVPILSEAGIGYSLMDGYRLPPIMFTKEEATAFLTAEKLVEKLTDANTFQIYQSALFKIKAVLKSEEKDHIESMYDQIEVVDNPYLPTDKRSGNYIQSILKSISSKQALSVEYFSLSKQEKSSRLVEPVGIFLLGHQWYLIAYCWMRKDYRNFRIDRIKKLTLTDHPFQRVHPSLKAYLNSVTKEEQELFTVVMTVDKKLLKYIGEQKYYNGYVSEREIGDQIEMTFLTSSEEGFARWYLMLGDQAEILKPLSLKKRIKILAEEILKKL